MPGLGPGSRVIDVGAGTGCLIPHFQSQGVRDILAIDLSPKMLEELQVRYPPPSTLGNDSGADPWVSLFLCEDHTAQTHVRQQCVNLLEQVENHKVMVST